ncbi:MAG: hypothetical protein ACYDCK_01405 [Thermoplasmatota archaeon]
MISASDVRDVGGRLAASVKARDMPRLARGLFDAALTPGQAEIASLLAFLPARRATVSAHTRFGKTFAAGVGLAALIVLDSRPLRVAVVAPRQDQALLVRNEFVRQLTASPVTMRLLGLERRGRDRIERELSRSRLNFRDGKTFRILSAADDADRLMGEGADVVLVEEAGLIGEAAWPKILRMLGDNPSESTLVELGNPWARGTRFEQHCLDAAYRHVHVDWRRGELEGRITRAFVEEMRREMSPAEFQVLYESVFPDSAEDQLVPWEWIQRAQTDPPLLAELAGTRYGLDVAEGGKDRTVLTRVNLHAGGVLDASPLGAWQSADTMTTVERVARSIPARAEIRVDAIGVGKGVADRLRQLGFNVVEIRVSEAARDPQRYRNRKAEAFWQVRELAEGRRLRISGDIALVRELARELTTYRYGTSSGKLEVWEDGARSPDYGDSLMLAVIEDQRRARLRSRS